MEHTNEQKFAPQFIPIFDGQYAVDPNDCPMYAKPGSIIVYDAAKNITIWPRTKICLPLCHVGDKTDIIEFNLLTGRETYSGKGPLFINHPKYGIIHNPTWSSMEECFKESNSEKECGYNRVKELLSLDGLILLQYCKKIVQWVLSLDIRKGEYLSPSERLNIGWQECFGLYYGKTLKKCGKLDKLTKEELVYFMFQCENYSLDEVYSIWSLGKEHGLFEEETKMSEDFKCGCVCCGKCRAK